MPSVPVVSAATSEAPIRSTRYILSLATWFGVATLAAASGILTRERVLLVPVSIVGGVLSLIAAYRRSEGFRAFAHHLDARWILVFHALRAPIGAIFLALIGRGLLTREFTLAGYGDILAGLGALALLPLSACTARGRRAWWLWNVVALADILLVFATAQRILLWRGDFAALEVLTRFPGPLLTLFVVPLVMATHLLVFARLRRVRGRRAPSA